eukprot:c13227_g1_i1.p1 GENE.c13227_g1_i1~~c13227_g1_i1.p1  ORF type:complete len:1346 (-),score=472.30 c13227_g1_i1:208-4245(-)
MKAGKVPISAPSKIGELKLFQKSLNDVIKGIRSHKKDASKYVSQVMKEIKDELSSPDMNTKATALQKLTYLDQLGYDMTWAAFHIVEVMSSPKFLHKRIGYLAAAQALDETTDVTLLTTNLFKKDFNAASPFEVGLALSCLSMIATPDLCHDLVSDVVAKLGASSPYVRKKAVLTLYKIFLRYPDALKPSFPRLKAKLTDDEPCVVSAAVNVICELARKNPQNYLGLAPVMYNILTSSSNNWMIIKVVKLFGALLPLEPRLGKKLRDPLSNILRTTQAKSLLYEAIHTVTVGMSDEVSVVALAAEKVRGFVEDQDQNLKFLGLVVMEKLVSKQPRMVMEYKDTVLSCLHDADVTIREQAVRVISGMASQRSLREIVNRLMEHCMRTEGTYQDFLVSSIVSMCSADNYSRITDISDFEWYVSLLVQLAALHSIANASLIGHQLLDVANRVRGARRFTAISCVPLLSDARLMSGADSSDNCCAILMAAAYIVGEFCSTILPEVEAAKDSSKSHEAGDDDELAAAPSTPSLVRVVDALVHTRIALMPPYVQRVYLQNAIKVYARAFCVVDAQEREELQALLVSRLPSFTVSPNAEVQERACVLKAIVDIVGGGVGEDTSSVTAVTPAAKSKRDKKTTNNSSTALVLLDDGNGQSNNNNNNDDDNGANGEGDDAAGTGTRAEAAGGSKDDSWRKEFMEQLLGLFEGELLPVSSKAQRKVKTELDLSQRLFDAPPKIRVEELKPDYVPVTVSTGDGGNGPASSSKFYSDDDEPDNQKTTGTSSTAATTNSQHTRDNSVFYLGGRDSGSVPSQDLIPMSTLDFGNDFDDASKGKKKHKSKHKKEKETARAEVFVAPKDDSDHGGNSSDDDALMRKMKQMGDLSRVKESDAGELPQLKHYTPASGNSSKKEHHHHHRSKDGTTEKDKDSKEKDIKDKDKKEKHRDKSKDSKDKDNDKKDKEKSKEKDSKEKDKSKSKGDVSGKDSKEKSSRSSKEALLLDLDNNNDDNDDNDKVAVVIADDEASNKKKKSSHGHSSSSKKSKDKENDKQQSDDGGDGDDNKRSHKKHHHKKSSTSAAPVTSTISSNSHKKNIDLLGDLFRSDEAAGTAGAADSGPVHQAVFGDNTLRVTAGVIGVRVSEDMGVDVEVELRMINKSSVHVPSASVSDVARGLSIHCGHAGLAPQAQHTQRLSLGVGVGLVTFDKPLESPCTVTYTGGQTGNSGESSHSAMFRFPVSCFLVPKPLPLPEYETLMRSTTALPFASSSRVSSPPFAVALRTISSRLRFHITASTDGAATLYAETIPELSAGMRVERVCLMIKHNSQASDAATLTASLRASHEGLAKALTTEISDLF